MPTPPPVIERIFRKLGGQAALGEDIRSEADLARIVRRGIRPSVLAHMRKAGFSQQEIEQYIIPARTLRHRRVRRKALSQEESDRVVRLTRIQALAEDVLGSPEHATQWLREPLGMLDGHSPLDVASTEAGARLVEELLAKIDWGAAA
jgi:putative toxin-antitoxin system antitoxin component (TIGR02293 family)